VDFLGKVCIFGPLPLATGLTDEVFHVRSILRHQQVFAQGGDALIRRELFTPVKRLGGR
jgi:hypothetical protein